MWTFKVSRVYKGTVGKRQEIVITPAGTDCGGLGLRHPGTEPVLVFAYKPAGDRSRLEPGQYASGLCSGSRPLADGGAPVLGWPWAGAPGWPDSAVGVGPWPRGWRPDWDWPPSGHGVGPAPTRLVWVMVLPLVAWSDGLPCSWTRGRWTPWHAEGPPGASDRANEVGLIWLQGPGVLSICPMGKVGAPHPTRSARRPGWRAA